MNKALRVWWAENSVGVLRIDEHGDLEFTYDTGWVGDSTKRAISVSLPKRDEPFGRRKTRPFFAGVLPDEGQRDLVARVLGVSERNDFRLLERLGGDVAGALTLWQDGEAPPVLEPLSASEPLSEDALIKVLETLPKRPLLAGDEGIRLSLAGAQQKLPVVLVDGQVALPIPGQPSTHILKPPSRDLPSSTENEALSLRLARAIGLDAASVETRRTGDHAYLLVERYDRVIDAKGVIRRLHQEDFCQALGIPPERKYASDGGPNFKPCFGLVREAVTQPAPALLRLIDAAIFNVAIGNADAHGKNFSLLYRDQSTDFAPLYDLLCTAAYPDVHAKLAMKIGKRSTLEEFNTETWTTFADDVGVAPPYVRRRAGALARMILDRIDGVGRQLADEGFDTQDLHRFIDVIRSRAELLLDLPAPRPLAAADI